MIAFCFLPGFGSGSGGPQYRHDFVSAPAGAVASMWSTISGSMRYTQSALFCCMVYSDGPPV